MSTVTKAENKIDVMETRVGVTKSGGDWMKTCLDPFPDDPRDCEGYPDNINGPSIVQKLKYQYTLALDSDSGITGNWDAHMFFDGFDTDYKCSQQVPVNTDGGGFYYNSPLLFAIPQQATPVIQGGGLNIRIASTGEQLVPDKQIHNISIPRSYFYSGRTRVIAKAFEVHNTTADIYKQGAVCTYRDPTVPSERMVIGAVQAWDLADKSKKLGGTDTGVRATFTSAQCGPHVPTTISTVMNILDSKEWEAKDGCYVVATLANNSIPLSNTISNWTSSVTPYFHSDGYFYVPNIALETTVNCGTFAMFNNITDNKSYTYPGYFNTSGAYFTGLSKETSLTVIVHYVIERFPDETNEDLVVLTTRSPAYDPAALELYSRMASYLPTGVRVKDNASGDWIKNIADLLATCGVPGMPWVKGAVDLWNKIPAMDKSVKVKKPKKGPTQQTNQQVANLNQKLKQLEVRVNNQPKQQPQRLLPRGSMVPSRGGIPIHSPQTDPWGRPIANKSRKGGRGKRAQKGGFNNNI